MKVSHQFLFTKKETNSTPQYQKGEDISDKVYTACCDVVFGQLGQSRAHWDS